MMIRKFDKHLFLKSYFFLILGIFLTIFLIFALVSYPHTYDFFVGDRVVKEHISEVVGDTNSSHETALAIMEWHHENVRYPLVENKKYLFAGSNGLYEVDNKTRLFLRSNSASWVIKTELARCGESAHYFMDVMENKGYKSRVIRTEPLSWDHVWAEYYDERGNKIVVDPSANKVILDKNAWVAGKDITMIIATDIDGNKEDITKEYLEES